MTRGWELIRQGVEMDDPTGLGRFLGCEHKLSTKTVKWQGMMPTDLDPPAPKQPKSATSGSIPAPAPHDPRGIEQENIAKRNEKEVRVIEYDMKDFFKSCVDLYADLTGTSPAEYPKVPTPSGPEATEIEYGMGGVAGRTCPPAEEALADLLEVPHPVEPTMRQVMEDSGMEY